jgi:hypothetical protein
VAVIGPDPEHQHLPAIQPGLDITVLEHQVPGTQQLLP